MAPALPTIPTLPDAVSSQLKTDMKVYGISDELPNAGETFVRYINAHRQLQEAIERRNWIIFPENYDSDHRESRYLMKMADAEADAIRRYNKLRLEGKSPKEIISLLDKDAGLIQHTAIDMEDLIAGKRKELREHSKDDAYISKASNQLFDDTRALQEKLNSQLFPDNKPLVLEAGQTPPDVRYQVFPQDGTSEHAAKPGIKLPPETLQVLNDKLRALKPHQDSPDLVPNAVRNALIRRIEAESAYKSILEATKRLSNNKGGDPEDDTQMAVIAAIVDNFRKNEYAKLETAHTLLLSSPAQEKDQNAAIAEINNKMVSDAAKEEKKYSQLTRELAQKVTKAEQDMKGAPEETKKIIRTSLASEVETLDTAPPSKNKDSTQSGLDFSSIPFVTPLIGVPVIPIPVNEIPYIGDFFPQLKLPAPPMLKKKVTLP